MPIAWPANQFMSPAPTLWRNAETYAQRMRIISIYVRTNHQRIESSL